MSSREHDPQRLDVARAAAQAAALSGRWPLATLTRLSIDAAAGGDSDVSWSARFEQRSSSGGSAQPWLHLRAQARAARQCQRCLEPVLLPLEVDRWLRFAGSEEEAAALDAESDDDVLALSRRFDLRELVEDELLLALPLVPRHDACAPPLARADEAEPPPADALSHPFAALAALKRPDGG